VVVGASVEGVALVDGLVLGSNEVLGNVLAEVVDCNFIVLLIFEVGLLTGNVVASDLNFVCSEETIAFAASAVFTSVAMSFSIFWVFAAGEVIDSVSRVGASVLRISNVFTEVERREVVDDGKLKMLSSWATGSASVVEEIPFVFVFVRIILVASVFSLDDNVEGDQGLSGLNTSS